MKKILLFWGEEIIKQAFPALLPHPPQIEDLEWREDNETVGNEFGS